MTPLRIVFVYALFSALWILFSDVLVSLIARDTSVYAKLSIIKGWLFIFATSLILLSLIRRYTSEQKQTEEKLQTSYRQVRAIYDASPDMIFIHGSDGRFVDVNENAVIKLGYPREELKSMFPSDISGDQYSTQARAMEKIAEALEGGAPDFEWMCKRKNGESFPVEVRLRRLENIGPDGKARHGVLSIVRDLSERKRLEDQFRQAQKMEAIGQLAGGIAHDFNNILHAIMWYGSIIKMKTLEPETKEKIEHILSLSEKAATLTKHLLAFSRKQIIETRPVNLNEIVDTVHTLLKRVLGANIELQCALSSDDLIVSADTSQMEQVLMNLATNANDAMPNEGRLTISTSEVTIDEDFIATKAFGEVGRYALLTVADTGTGMEQKTQDKIFEPFFTTKEVGKGTGLGLAMVYGTVRQHNGFIDVASRPGKGTTFSIYLPIVVAAPLRDIQQQLLASPRGTETILLAEDNEDVRKITRTILEEFGYSVIEAIDGEDAVEKCRAHKGVIALLLSDLVMPRKNGKEAYLEIKSFKPDIKVLFISGYAADVGMPRDLSGHQLEYISKTTSPMILLAKIRQILDSKTGEL